MQRYQQAIGPDVQPCELRQSTSSIKGINGQVNTSGTRRLEVCFQLESQEDSFAVGTIDSTELCNSDAPLLLSIKDQRRLQLQVNLGDDNTPDKVYSRLLGGYLKVIDLNGLLGLHLLPSQIAMLGMTSGHDSRLTPMSRRTMDPKSRPHRPQQHLPPPRCISDLMKNNPRP